MSLLSKAKGALSKRAQRQNQYPHVERELSEGLGLPLDTLKGIRSEQLVRSKHWELVGNEIRYTDEGKKIALMATGAALPVEPVAEPPSPTPPASSGPQIGEVRTLTCFRTYRNPHLVEARDGDEVAWVRVRSNRKFKQGMEIKARYLGRERWAIEGRGPRFNGKY